MYVIYVILVYLLLLVGWIQRRLKSKFDKYSKMSIANGMTVKILQRKCYETMVFMMLPSYQHRVITTDYYNPD